MRLSNHARWLPAVAAALAIALLGNFLHATTPLKHLDSVFLFEATDSILDNGRPESRSIASWPNALRSYAQPAAELCVARLQDPTTAPYNVMDNHAYLGLYPLALLSAALGSEWIYALLTAAAHVLIALLAYRFLRRQQVGVGPSLLFVAVIVAYPALARSLEGDYYLDRLYMPLALGALYTLHGLANATERTGETRRLFVLCVLVVGAAMMTERAAIMMVGALAYFAAMYPAIRRSPRALTVSATLVLCLLVYLAVYFQQFYVGIESGGNLGKGLLKTLHAPLAHLGLPGMPAFFAVNTLMLFLAAWGGPRALLLAAGAMLPNLLISVGGAELNGWTTHYHVMYVPFLVFAASLGWMRLARSAGSSWRLAALAAVAWILAAVIDPASAQREPAFTTLRSGLLGKVHRFYLHPAGSYEKTAARQILGLRKMIPPGARVSTIPQATAALYRKRALLLYPIGMDDADYLVVSDQSGGQGEPLIGGATSYLGAAEQQALNACLANRVRGHFSLQGEIRALGVLVFRRDRRPASGRSLQFP